MIFGGSPFTALVTAAGSYHQCYCSESLFLGGSPFKAATHRKSSTGEEWKRSSLATAAGVEGTKKGDGIEEEEGRRKGESRVSSCSRRR